MPFEDSVAELLRAAADLAPATPGELLADAAERRGRRRAARRRAALSGGAAGLVMAAVLAVQLHPGSTPAPPTSRQPAVPAGPPSALATLLPLLPPGRTSEVDTLDHATGTGPAVNLVFDGGHGASLVKLSTATVGLPIGEDTVGTQCRDPFLVPTEGCTRTVRPDGSVLVLDRSAATATAPVRTWSAVYTRTDGRQVRLDEFDSATGTPPVTGADPALSAEQLTAVVTSPSWNDLVGPARPVSAPPSGPLSRPAPRAAEILADADRLLPAGVRYDNGSMPQTGSGEAHLTVTAAGATGALVITVDPDLLQGAGDARRAFEGGAQAGRQLVRTANGSSVIVPTNSGAAATRWVVQAMLPDGTGVTVSENNGTHAYDVQGGTPVLTVDQLTAIATDLGWQRH